MSVLALLLALPLAAPLADDPAFVEGQRLYQESEYEQAVFRFQTAALVADRAAAERARALTWLGLAYAGAGDAEAARRAFEDALLLDPQATIPVEVSPKIEEEFEAVRAALAATPRAAPASAHPPAPPGPPRAAPESGGPWVLAGSVGALGALCVAAGAVATGFAFANKGIIDDPETFQDDAARAQVERDAQVIAAAALFGAGALLLGGGAMVVLDAAP